MKWFSAESLNWPRKLKIAFLSIFLRGWLKCDAYNVRVIKNQMLRADRLIFMVQKLCGRGSWIVKPSASLQNANQFAVFYAGLPSFVETKNIEGNRKKENFLCCLTTKMKHGTYCKSAFINVMKFKRVFILKPSSVQLLKALPPWNRCFVINKHFNHHFLLFWIKSLFYIYIGDLCFASYSLFRSKQLAVMKKRIIEKEVTRFI